MSRVRYGSEEKKNALQNNKLLYKAWEVVIKISNDYSSIVYEAKYKAVHEKRLSSTFTSHPLDLASLAKVSGRSHLKILSPKQMLQRLPVALAQVKAGNTSENLLNEIR